MICSRRLYKGNAYEICLPLTDTGVTLARFYTAGDVIIEKVPVITGDSMCFSFTEEEIASLPDGVLRYELVTEYETTDTNSPYVIVTPGDYSGSTLDDLLEEAYDSGLTACSGAVKDIDFFEDEYLYEFGSGDTPSVGMTVWTTGCTLDTSHFSYTTGGSFSPIVNPNFDMSTEPPAVVVSIPANPTDNARTAYIKCTFYDTDGNSYPDKILTYTQEAGSGGSCVGVFESGLTEGFESGVTYQKSRMRGFAATYTSNASWVYENKETGYDKIEITIAVPSDSGVGYTSGYTDGYESGYTAGQTDCSGDTCEGVYESGVTAGEKAQKAKLSALTITSDWGNYTNVNGWSSVTVNVPMIKWLDEEIMENGRYTYDPYPDYKGYKGAKITVNVPDRYNEGYYSGRTDGYASGYSAGQTACTDGRTYLTFTDLSLDSASWNSGSTIYLWPNTNSNWDGETCKSVRLRTSKDGVNWSEEVEYTSAATFEIAPGESLMFDGSSNTTWSFNGDNGNWRFWCFSGAGNNIEVGGDISSLIGFREMTLPGTFMDLFMRFTKLHSAKHLVLPFSAVPAYAFNSMFYKCTGLQAAPSVLPAMTLGEFCYKEMFWQTAMVRPPALPATVLAKGCYEDMFYDSRIWSPPELPATVLAERCYNGMFIKSSIRDCPELPATNLAPKCYMNMFYECPAIVSAATLPAEVLAEDCYWDMFYDCNGLVETPVLPAKVLTQNCYMGMFVGCDSITGITCLATDISASGCTGGWLSQIGQSGVFYCDPSMVNTWQHGFDGVPTNWTIEPYSS